MSHKTLESVQPRLTKTAEANKPTWTDQEVWGIIAEARGWIDVPFRHQGRSTSGVDCIGIFSCISQKIGRNIPVPNNYTHHPDQKFLLSEMERLFDRIEKSELAPGDLVLLRFADDRRRVPNRHVAIRTDLGLLHASATFRKVTEHTLDDEWLAKIEHCFRLRRVKSNHE